jgi:ribosomal protein L29
MKGLKDNKALVLLDAEGLKKELNKAKQELYVLKMKHVANELKETHLLKAHKAYVARISTYLNAF